MRVMFVLRTIQVNNFILQNFMVWCFMIKIIFKEELIFCISCSIKIFFVTIYIDKEGNIFDVIEQVTQTVL